MNNIVVAWNQKRIPVVWRRARPPIWLRVPFKEGNRAWIQDGKRTDPYWNKDEKRWELPATWFNGIVDRALDRWGRIYIIQPFREQEKCAPACRNARGHECQCSCMGAHHGAGDGGGWFDVSETFSVRWGGEDLALRLLTKRS